MTLCFVLWRFDFLLSYFEFLILCFVYDVVHFKRRNSRFTDKIWTKRTAKTKL